MKTNARAWLFLLVTGFSLTASPLRAQQFIAYNVPAGTVGFRE